jgi:hypothetical protein
MHCGLGWRQLEDQPAFSCVDVPKAQDIAEEDPIGFCIATVENDMGAGAHGLPSLSVR